ncbi:transporter, CPA2 family [Stanieria cyanosphaera PCC 7437]|uniref:Transporter, CPA2 family n=1 Tax=Stanieria cyanosphaera (strain ATCC 29371 / PCC 7437) TaxID=111780 RepID=K9XR75_STAC7|nr:cation:proton antiporter [Stanieria cyanosphaera]AFZ35110.1 transporter, CPA2 family [Stanieria cyanosphaera PCC 7437]
MEQNFAQFITSPIVSFTLLLLVILTLPPIFEKLRLPGLVGLLFAGVILGSDGLGLLDPKSETIKLLSDIGKIYLMFVAGLEIDLADFRKTKNRSLGFGFATFIIPLTCGTLIGLLFGMNLNASVLIGSLLASHTLLAYPIVNRLGIVNNQAVTVTIGATIFTDISALLVLAICISINAGEFTPLSLVIQLVTLGIYSAIVLFGFDWAGKEYFRRTGNQESNQFLFILLAVFLAAVGAQIIDVENIVGAFLAGLAVNDVVGKSQVKEKVEFVGSTLFIPCFFVGMGLLLDISGFIKTLSSELPLTLAIVGGLILSKFLAAFVVKLLYHYSWDETITMWSLSLPQVAATLAAALVGLNAGVISQSVFNTVIVLMLVTSILGPILTDKFARKLTVANNNLANQDFVLNLDLDNSNPVVDSGFLSPDVAAQLSPQTNQFLASQTSQAEQTLNLNDTSPSPLFRVVVPVANPQTERYLIEMGALIARHESGIVIPVSIAKAQVNMDDPDLTKAIQHSRQLLKNALTVTEDFKIPGKPVIRIDDDIVQGITRTAREHNASLIIMGWSQTNRLRSRLLGPNLSRLFGNVIDSVFWCSHCPVAVMRLLTQPTNIQQILVPVKNITSETLRVIRFAQIFAEANQSAITLFHVSDRKTSKEELKSFKTQLKSMVEYLQPNIEVMIKTTRNNDVAKAIIERAQSYDLIILRSVRRRTVAGLAVSDVSESVMNNLNCSLVLFGEPYSS